MKTQTVRFHVPRTLSEHILITISDIDTIDTIDTIAEAEDDEEDLEDVFSPQPMDPSLGGLSLDEDGDTNTYDSTPELTSYPKTFPKTTSPTTPGSPKSPPMIHEHAAAKVDEFRLSGVVKVDAAALMDGDGELHSDEDEERDGRVCEVEQDGEAEKQVLLFVGLDTLVEWEPISTGRRDAHTRVRVKESEEARMFAEETGVGGKEWVVQIVNGDKVSGMVQECIQGLLDKCDGCKGTRAE